MKNFTSTQIFALSVIVKNWELQNISTDEWLNKLEHPYYGILLGNKESKLLIDTTTWMGLQGIMLVEISQSQKAHTLYHTIYRNS